MDIVIALLVVALGLVTYAVYSRKSIYDQVDKLEAWKNEIMNRSVTEELANVKQLKMTGQTEEKFEHWRTTWDEIIDVLLPDVEERLFDAEEAADKYRFKRAKGIVKEVSRTLTDVEEQIEGILNDLNELIGSEENNKTEIETQAFQFRELKKKLLTHGHQFGKTALRIEKKLDEVEELFKAYKSESEQGNIIHAREIVGQISNQLIEINESMELIPKLLSDCKQFLPHQLKELHDGYHEMVEEGYILDHLRLEEELSSYEKQLNAYAIRIEKLDLTDIEPSIQEMKNRVDEIYEFLEHEAISRHYVNKEVPLLRPHLKTFKAEFDRTKEETELVQMSYQLTKDDIEEYYHIDKSLSRFTRKYEAILVKLDEQSAPYSSLKEEFEDLKVELEMMIQKHKHLDERLQMLRKDEINAKEQLAELKDKLKESKRLIKQSNLPGITKAYREEMEKTDKLLVAVVQKLVEKPLNTDELNEQLDYAIESVNSLTKLTAEMLEQAVVVEMMIQYGNRFRSVNKQLDDELIEVEQLFRSSEYDLAYDQASAAIEQVEPGSVEKIYEIISK